MDHEASSDTKFLEDIIESINKVREKIDSGAEDAQDAHASGNDDAAVDATGASGEAADVIGDTQEVAAAIVDAHDGGGRQDAIDDCGRVVDGGDDSPSPAGAFSCGEGEPGGGKFSDIPKEAGDLDQCDVTPRVLRSITDEERIGRLSQSAEELRDRFSSGLSKLCQNSGPGGPPLGPIVPVARDLRLGDRMRSGAVPREVVIPWRPDTSCTEAEDAQSADAGCGRASGDGLDRFHALDVDYTPSTQNPLAVRSDVSEADRVRAAQSEDDPDRTLAQLLRPLLVKWVDDNLPAVVENALRIESSGPDSTQGRH